MFNVVDEPAGTCERCGTARAGKFLLCGVKLDGVNLVLGRCRLVAVREVNGSL